MAINPEPIRAFRAREELESKMLAMAERLARALGDLRTEEEAFVLVSWLNDGFLEPDAPLDEQTIGYKEGAAIVAALPSARPKGYDEILRGFRRSSRRGPAFDRASERLLSSLDAAGWANTVPRVTPGGT